MTERGDAILLMVQCPYQECANRVKQSAQYSRAELKRMLEAGEEIRAFGSICGHDWNLSVPEKENTLSALRSGAL